MQDRINFNQSTREIEQHFANLNSGLGGVPGTEGQPMASGALTHDQLQSKLSERQQVIEQYKKLRKEN